MTLREGRDFTWSDDISRPRVAIVSRSLAERLFPGQSAIGQEINFGPTPAGQHIEIVGIINDVELYNVKRTAAPTLLLSVLQDPEPEEPSLLLRGSASASAVRQAVASLGRDYVFRTRSLDEIVRGATRQERLAAIVGTFFGSMAVALAAIGLYGLLTYVVARRTREFAIRVALGGRAWTVMKLVLAQGLSIVAVGVVLGGIAAIVNVRWLQSLLYGIKLHDALALSIIPVILAVFSVSACAIPALRSARVDPLILLREE
jgi:putative ABC transport system permease protein